MLVILLITLSYLGYIRAITRSENTGGLVVMVDIGFNSSELRRCVLARTRAMCGCKCACLCEIHSEKCVRYVCVRLVFRRAMYDHTFAHFLEQNGQKKLFFIFSKNYSRMSYPVLEHPFLL